MDDGLGTHDRPRSGDVPDTDEALERELRRSVATRRPPAPESLHEFVRRVPAERPARSRIFLGREAYRRRGVGAAVLAAALVVGLAGSALIVSFRTGQRAAASGSPGASGTAGLETSPAVPGVDFVLGGWGWQRVGDPAPGPVGAVPNGFVGECVADGLPAICTSSDAVTWSTQADPTIAEATGDTPFHGWSVAQGGSAWVATSGIDSPVWQSSDGTGWTESDVGVAGLEHGSVQAWGSGVALLGEAAVGSVSSQVLLRSSDGIAWERVSVPAGASNPRLAGAIGVTVSKPGRTEGSLELWASADGSAWAALDVPAGTNGIASAVKLPRGGFAAIGVQLSGRTGDLLVSGDGRSWKAATGIGSPVSSIALAGDRLLATASVPGSALFALYASPDAVTWTRLAVLDGSPLAGTTLVSLGDRVAAYDGSRLVAVGSPLPPGTTAPSPSPSAAGPVSSPGSAAGAFVAGGWRWHALNLSPEEPVVRLPNGYLGRCGDSMCTSSDGWTWQTPPDPAIFATDGPALFLPFSVSRRPGGGSYVLAAAEGLWYSSDGVRWRPSSGPSLVEATVMAGPAGFAAIAYVAAESSMRLYLSDDGVTWARASSNLDHYFYVQGHGDTSAGVIGGVDGKTAYMYSTDGRSWKPVTLPAGAYGWAIPARLPDGSLLAAPGGNMLLRSGDGLTWTKVKTAWLPTATYMATEGNRVLVVGGQGSREGLLFESTDSARTFRQIMDGVTAVGQWGDLAAVKIGGATYVGTPLTPEELATTTPSPEKPGVSQAPVWTPEPSPSGGISKDEAIRIAVAATDPTPEVAATVRAGVDRSYAPGSSGRWVWNVSFTESGGGQGTTVEIDYYTGRVLNVGRWIS